MKYLISLGLIFVSINLAKGQSKVSNKSQVENGIAPQSIVLANTSLELRSISDKLNDNNINGISVAVVHKGQIDWMESYGVRKNGSSDSVTNNTLFQCASIGKLITTLAALQLVKDGKIILDEPINNKLKRWQFADNKFTAQNPVTLRHLLSHSSGLADEYGFPGYTPNKAVPSTLQILNAEKPSNTRKELTITTVPGEVEKYSGAGYLVIQLLIEDLSKQSFIEYVQQSVLDPFEMTKTTYSDRPDQELGVAIAVGHKANGKALKNKDYHIYPEKAAAGPWTTTEDLAKLIIGIQSMKDPIKDDMLSPQINNKGLGFNLKGVDQPEAFWHAGQNEGYTGLLYGLTNSGDGAVVLTNSIGGEEFIQEFMASVARVYNWPVMNSYNTIALSDELIKNISGTYVSEDGSRSIAIDSEQSRIYVKPNGSKKGIELLCIGDNRYTFSQAQDYYKISFKEIEDSVVSMTYTESIGKSIILIKEK